ncbi:hypothetical protein Cri9333_0420 [Crinalium epipsammum PCC 9333]|uniref:DUF6876 domain-containing protein n=1 Tax=Crinalium epipsammum PCC 9333 TaxID=1173022 RepID=K9VTV7_9CYAN|nr:DUF6876 family protein [Crinalium epipsammum]AFZ11391.1 hypothetical protein Cri9333_0420 [Crinalium epipsammum PCC 9333]
MELTQVDIDQCTRTQKTYVHRLGIAETYAHRVGITEIHYTEGVHLVATKGKAFWLLAAILSYQNSPVIKQTELKDFQLWELNVSENKTAVLTCRIDDDLPPLISQKIAITDFPLPYLRLIYFSDVLRLFSECK